MNKDELMQVLGDNLRRYREKNNLTQEQLAEKAGISTSFYANIERGKKGVSIYVLRDISKAIGVSIDCLLEDSNSDSKIRNIEILLKDKPASVVQIIEEITRIVVDNL